MYAPAAIATQPNPAPKGRTVAVRAQSDGMAFDLPRGS